MTSSAGWPWAPGSVGMEQGEGSLLNKGLPGMLSRGRPGAFLRQWRRQCGKRDGSGGKHGQLLVSASALGTGQNLLHCPKAGIQALLGRRSEQRSDPSHPCSTGSSQRKAARSAPTPVTPGFKDTCKTCSRTEQSKTASVAAATRESRIPSSCDGAGRWSNRGCTSPRHLQVAAGDCWRDTARYLVLGRARLAPVSLQPPPSALTPLPVAWEGPWVCTSSVLILF